jgi:4'-phosphopantetheinyl transferase EntD
VDLIALPGERRWLAGLGARGGVAWDRLLFSCKETVYKASFPLSRRWLGFEDVAVRAGPGSPAFTATILARAPVLDGRELTRLSGRWMARDGLLLTAVTVPHGRPERA